MTSRNARSLPLFSIILGAALVALCPTIRAQTSPGGPTPGPTPYPIPTNTTPPAVVVFEPTNGSVFFAPANVFIDVLAIGGTNQVTLVQFFANGGLIGSITNPVVPPGALPPVRLTYSLDWSNVVVGSYSLTASATFQNGKSLTSTNPVSIMVETPPPPTNPIVNIVYPTNGSTFYAPANIPLLAEAYVPGGIVKTVEFFENGTSIGAATNNPIVTTPANIFHLLWTNVNIGPYALTAVATSDAGLTSTSSAVNINVIQAPSNQPPTVVMITPTNGQAFTAPADVLIAATVSDPDAFVNYIAFYSGTNLINARIVDPLPGETNTQPVTLSFLWQAVPPGSYALTVVAGDTHGQSATSAPPVNITVTGSTNPVPPVVGIVATDPIAVEGTNCCFVSPVSVFTNFCTGTNTATFLVFRRGDASNDLDVTYSIGGTASNGVDYATLPGDVTIPAGQRFALITVDPLEDVDSSNTPPFSTVVLTLTPPPTNAPPSYTIGFPRKAAAIILEECFLPVPVACPMADSCFRVAWPAANGQNYCIELSSDLVNWTPVCTNTVVKGSIQFVDPEAPDNPTRFYRSVPAALPGVY